MSNEDDWDDWPGVDDASQDATEPDPKCLAVLNAHFGHSSFRPMQWRIVHSIIAERRDNCVIMATGYGKSLTYQFPPVFLNRLAFVVSPLISLMEDQVLSLNVCNIPACLLGTAQRENLLPDIQAGAYRVVYLTPEYITGDAGQKLLQSVTQQLALVAIDEAHCLSKWGHDFRPAYRNLGLIRRTCPSVPILAVTATATPKVRDDIVRSLGLTNPQHLCTGFDRPNLEFIVRPKGVRGVLDDLKPLLVAANRDGSAIIYCLTRKQTDEIVELLRGINIECEGYHAGLSIKQRRSVHERFVRDQVQIVVATVAFGMGIDKPDVRLVVHYGASNDLESYYQGAGRAGRDGQPARCIMFWNRSDFKTHELLRSNLDGAVQNNLARLSDRMQEYLDTRDCRRRFILQYFEEELGREDNKSGDSAGSKRLRQPGKRCCDNCTHGGLAKDSERYEGIDAQGRYDFTADTEMLLQAVELFNGNSSLSLPILLLRGSKNKKLHERYYREPLFGKGKAKSEDWWKELGTLLEREGFLSRTKIPNMFNRFASIVHVQLASNGRRFLNSHSNDRKLLLKPTTEMFKSITVVASQAASSSDHRAPGFLPPSQKARQDITQELMEVLLTKRSELATAFECMPYMIASNAALYKMATRKPLNLTELKEAQLDGFSDAKVQKFGPEFLACIQQKLKLLPQATATTSTGTDDGAQKLGSSAGVSVSLFTVERKSPAEIATMRKLAISTVVSHLCDGIRAGVPFDQAELVRLDVGPDVYRTIAQRLPADFATCTLSSIKERCPPEITYNQIKVVLAWERQKKLNPAQEMKKEENDLSTAEKEPCVVVGSDEEKPADVSLHDMLNDGDDDVDGVFDLAERDWLEASKLMDEHGPTPPEKAASVSLEGCASNGVKVEPVEVIQPAAPTTDHNQKESAFGAKTDTRGSGRPVNLKRIMYDDDEEEGASDKEDKDMNLMRLPKQKTDTRGSGRPVNLKRIMYDDDEEEGASDKEDKDMNLMRLPKQKTDTRGSGRPVNLKRIMYDDDEEDDASDKEDKDMNLMRLPKRKA
uniref:DNA 3'-5' helicase n=1 Tax=Anopheles dirus TaxID=7168 RepID=A0A182NL71_9DIPT